MLLEAEVERLKEREQLLLDRLLTASGHAPLTASEAPRITPKMRPHSIQRQMAQMEAQKWQQFNDAFPTVEDVLSAKKAD